ncbi:MAG: TAXI family TRAP transporter solute-binding subunit [Desulfobacteraceae bacterium]|nr:TAXI family TRAP transporter solute-binding subunit [Desulfobacteraceae bacterium]
MSKWLKMSVLLVVTLAFTLIAIAPGNAQKSEKLRLGANAIGSIMYAFSGGIADVVEKHTEMQIELLPQGNTTALPMLTTGECDFVMGAADELDAAYFGKDHYGKISPNGLEYRMMMLGCRLPAGLVAGGNTGVKSCKDVKGKRVVCDYGTHQALNMGSRAALAGCGLTEDDVIVVKASLLPEGARKVMEGKADLCYGAIGVPVFREMESAIGARHISINDTPENWEKIHEIYHGYFPMHIDPSKAAFSVKDPEGVDLVGRHFAIVGRKDLPDEVAYEFVKTLWENDQELAPYHPRLKDWVKKHFASERTPAPYHPGAIKFYKEMGVWDSELEAHNQKLLDKKQALME